MLVSFFTIPLDWNKEAEISFVFSRMYKWNIITILELRQYFLYETPTKDTKMAYGAILFSIGN